MTHREGSLWSPEIKPDVLSPRSILESQASSLREQSDGLLAADLKAVTDECEGAVYLTLEMYAPSLPGNRHRVLTARHFGERIFPCHIDADGLRGAEVAQSSDEFLELLRQVLHSGEVKSLAQSLIARAVEARKPASDSGVIRKHNGHRQPFRSAWVGVEADNDAVLCVESLYDERSAGD